jgi:hypothetical protein
MFSSCLFSVCVHYTRFYQKVNPFWCCIFATLVYLNVYDPPVAEDEVFVDLPAIGPDAVIALG